MFKYKKQQGKQCLLFANDIQTFGGLTGHPDTIQDDLEAIYRWS